MEFQNVFRISSRDKHVHKILNCKATFPDGSDGKDSACSAGDLGSILGLGRFPEKGKATHSVFLPGEFHGQRSLAGYSPWAHKELDTTKRLTLTHTSSTLKPSI